MADAAWERARGSEHKNVVSAKTPSASAESEPPDDVSSALLKGPSRVSSNADSAAIKPPAGLSAKHRKSETKQHRRISRLC